MIHNAFQVVTHLGDSPLLIPLSLAGIGILLWNGHRPAALRFAIAVAMLMAVILALKIAFYAIGGDASLDVLSPSGHAGFSVTVYGCGAAMLAKQCRQPAAGGIIAAVTALVVAVLASRVALGVHSVAEVVLGGAVGLFCTALFLVRNPDLESMRLRLPLPAVLALALGVLAIWAEGRRFNAEGRIEHVGVLVGKSLGTLLPQDLVPGHANHVRRLTE